jgi:hypothetical protein
MIDTERIETFLNHQTEHWNQGDKQAFLEDYRRVRRKVFRLNMLAARR